MDISDEDCETARIIAAEVVRMMGERYWPLFELVDAECTRRRQRRERLRECLRETGVPRRRSRRV
tara:strand:- start:16597 stop:16791 length:195 start_codon:yes stop_codon:yes gene_type:complete